MALAADLLVEQETATVADIARTVGYADPFGFSAAFKRTRGVDPSGFRRAATATSPADSRTGPDRTAPPGPDRTATAPAGPNVWTRGG
ncbi:Helix-turn-helix domain-containing protein [Streptomyces qinglanensis]|uniref:Helix-turn-helix domain-containing protein n=1 Tax=Streptomyces qinglanensis TaxID=943816 RepID=A0A1H9VJB3_9ACTN|nr:Helix-turn-helix domain-containing protein [Streptomyces qinglanensis]